MRVYTKSTLRKFWEKYPDCKDQLLTWYKITEKASWNSVSDIKEIFKRISVLKDNRIVFDIKGNHYRLIVKFNFTKGWAFIRFFGTHSEYDKIDANII